MQKSHGRFDVAPRPDARGPRRQDHVESEDPLNGIRQVAYEEYRPGQEQYTLFTWAAGIDQRWPQTVDTRGVRRYVKNLAVLAVGYSGLPEKNPKGSRELVSVIAPLETTPDWGQVTGVPIARTLAHRENAEREPFDLNREFGWAEASGFLAEQLFSLFRVCGVDGKPEQHHHVAGKSAARSPKLVVNLDVGVTHDGAPKPPSFVAVDDIEDPKILENLSSDAALFDLESLGSHAYDIRKWTTESRPLIPIYSMTPWFVLQTNIRSVHAALDGVRAHWWLR